MEESTIIKANFEGNLRLVEVKGASFAELDRAVRHVYRDQLPSGDLVFTYKDDDKDDVRFDTDAELVLAIRTSRSPLRVTVTAVDRAGVSAQRQEQDRPQAFPGAAKAEEDTMDENDGTADGWTDDDPVAEAEEAEASNDPEASALFKTAVARLGEVHGVDITPTHLARALTLLQLRPRLLVARGLAPQSLLCPGGTSDDEAGVETSSKPSAAAAATVGTSAATAAEEEKGQEGDKEQTAGGASADEKTGPGPRAAADLPVGRPLHRVLRVNGVEVAPEQVPALLWALGVSPLRFVELGLLDMETFLGSVARMVAHALGGDDGAGAGAAAALGCGVGGANGSCRFGGGGGFGGRGFGGGFGGVGVLNDLLPPPAHMQHMLRMWEQMQGRRNCGSGGGGGCGGGGGGRGCGRRGPC